MNIAAPKQISKYIFETRNESGEVIRDVNTTIEEAKIYIGLNDSETKQQKFETGRYISTLKYVCRSFGVPFSFNVVDGGYIHDNGEYTEEKTIVLTFIDQPQETVDEIAKDLCVIFHQESVLVTTDRVHVRSICERL